MPSEDITFCTNDKCDVMNCFRNPKHIRLPIPHSFAFLEGTEDCIKYNRDVDNINAVDKHSH